MIDQQVQDRVAAYRGRPEQLQQKYAMGQDLLDLLALQKIKSEKEAAARQMQLQLAQQQAAQGQAPMTVAQQREKEVHDLTKQELVQQRGATLGEQNQERQEAMQKMMQGIAAAPGAQSAAQPQAMAAGGIVGFAGPEGSLVGEDAPVTYKQITEAEGRAAQLKPEYWFLPESGKYREAVAEYERLKKRYDEGAAARAKSEYAKVNNLPPPPAPKAPAADTGKAAPAAPVAKPAANPAGIITASGAQSAPPEVARAAGVPQAPAMPKPATPAAAPAVGAPQLDPTVAAGIKRAAGIDFQKIGQDTEDRVTKALGVSPEEQRIIDAANATLQRQHDERFDPEYLRREGIKRFLLGAGGRRYNEFGGGAAAAMDYDAATRKEQDASFANLQKSLREPFGVRREAAKTGIDVGQKAAQTAGAVQGHGITAGASTYNTDSTAYQHGLDRVSRERVAAMQDATERLKAQISAETNRIMAQGQADARAITALSNIEKTVDGMRRNVQASFVAEFKPLLEAEATGMIKPDQKKQLDAARLTRDLQLQIIENKLGPALANMNAKIGGGGGGTLNDGFGQMTTKPAPSAKP